MTEFVTTPHGDRVAFDRIDGSPAGSHHVAPALIFVAGAGPFRAGDPVTTATAGLVSAHGITTIVYDRLGRGESVAEAPIHLDRELAALTALIEVAGGSAVLCGHSSGCSISLYAAAKGLPIDGLVLWEAPLKPEHSDSAEWAAEIGARLDAGDKEGALVHYMKDMPPEWLAGARQSPAWPMMYANVDGHRPDAESLAWAESGDRRELFASIRVPVETIVGVQTMPFMESATQAIVAAIPTAVSKRVAGANHSWDPEAMAEELVEFVKSLAR